MIKNKFLGLMAIIALIVASCGDTNNKQATEGNPSNEIERTKAQTAAISPASFSDGRTTKVFQNYQEIRQALVNSDADEVQVAAENLADSFSEERDGMKSTAMAMAETADIEKQRQLFSDFTESVEPMFKAAISDGTIYKQFCPMAFKGKGGYWISDVDEIRNPYYGKKMLKCGKVTETITK